jgi:hypothetical protein
MTTDENPLYKCYIKGKYISNTPSAIYSKINGSCRYWNYISKTGSNPTLNYPPYYQSNISLADCTSSCSIDPKCSGYNYTVTGNNCQLFDSTFTNNPGTSDSYAAINYVDTSDKTWNCYTKQNLDPVGYTKFTTPGKCININQNNIRSELPYSLIKTTFNDCVKLCDIDTKCSGISYKIDGSCYIHDPSIPLINNSNSGLIINDVIPPTDNAGIFCYAKQRNTTSSSNTLSEHFSNTNTNNSGVIFFIIICIIIVFFLYIIYNAK